MRDHFDLDPKLIYLNSGTHSVCPRSVLQALQKHQTEFERNPTLNLFGTWGKLWAVQKRLAGFFGADPHDLFLRPNVTAALNLFLLGIPLPPRSEILTTDLEYGAIVNICRYRAQKDGLSLRALHLSTDPQDNARLTPAEIVRQIIDELRPETSLLLISHVMTANGLVIPLETLARETRKRGILLVVDGAHGPGSVDLDFTKLQDVDFYGGNLHKWMLGPKGTSFGWIATRHRGRLEATHVGWTTFEIPVPFKEFGDGNAHTAQLLMSACHDWAPFLAIEAMLDFWQEQTPTRIQARSRALLAKTRQAMEETGWPLISPTHPELAGPLLTYAAPPRLAALGYDLMFKLERAYGLQVATPPVQGRAVVRLSPAVYNTEEEIARAVSILSHAEASLGCLE